MPVLPGHETEALEVDSDYAARGKTVDRPDAYSRFPRYNHNKDTNRSTLTLSHPDKPENLESADVSQNARYRHTPAATNPFESRPTQQVRGIRKGYEGGVSNFRVNEENVAIPAPVLSRKAVPKEEPAHVPHGGKKPLKTPNQQTTNTVPDPSVTQEALRGSSRYQNSKRFEEKPSVVAYDPTPVQVKEFGKDQRYKHTVVTSSLNGVFTPTRDNCEDRTAQVQRPPWALE